MDIEATLLYVLSFACVSLAVFYAWHAWRVTRDVSRLTARTEDALQDNRALTQTLGLVLQSNQRLNDLLREEQEKDKK